MRTLLTEKNPKTKTIEVSTEMYDKLCGIKSELARIFHKEHVGFDEVLRVLCSPKLIDYAELLGAEAGK